MKIVVIGGNGFIGSHVLDRLLAAGHQLTVIDRGPERFRAPIDGVEYIQGSFADLDILRPALIGVDAVLHLASATVPGTAAKDPIADVNGNLVGTLRLLDAMHDAGVPQLLYLSSGGTVYGIPQMDPVPEIHPLEPNSSYGIVKVAIESYIRAVVGLRGLKATILRPSNPYGPRQGNAGIQGVIGTYLSRQSQGKSVELWGDGSIVRDFVYVGDVADLCHICVEECQVGSFNAGAGTGHAIKNIITKIEAVTGKPMQIEMRPGREFDVPRVVLDIAHVTSETGWTPQTSLTEGLLHTWKCVQDVS